MIPFLFGFALACFMWGGVFLWLDHRRRRVSGITKHARRDQHEFVQRKYRDAEIVATVAAEVGGIDYRFLGQTGCESD